MVWICVFGNSLSNIKKVNTMQKVWEMLSFQYRIYTQWWENSNITYNSVIEWLEFQVKFVWSQGSVSIQQTIATWITNIGLQADPVRLIAYYFSLISGSLEYYLFNTFGFHILTNSFPIVRASGGLLWPWTWGLYIYHPVSECIEDLHNAESLNWCQQVPLSFF